MTEGQSNQKGLGHYLWRAGERIAIVELLDRFTVRLKRGVAKEKVARPTTMPPTAASCVGRILTSTPLTQKSGMRSWTGCGKAARFALHNRSGGAQDNLVRSFRFADTPALQTLRGQSLQCTWKRRVVDHDAADLGKLNRWSLKISP